jgi:phthiocerol/phenolphthiocerol synthesis type-I polyketide synthase B
VAPVDAVIAAVSSQNRFARRVNMEVASHTALMDPILPGLRTALADLTPESLTIPFYSTVVEDIALVDGKPPLDAEYWVNNVRKPARLSQAITAAAQDHATFIEISAHPILTHAINDTLESVTHHHSVGTLWRDGDDTVSFHTHLNAAHTSYPPQTTHPPEPHPVLPTTPWHHTRHWIPLGAVRSSTNRVAFSADSQLIPAEWWCELTWPARELPGAEVADADGTWLVITDSDVGAEMTRMLGASVTVVSEDADDAALADTLTGVTHVLYAPQVSSGHFEAESGYALFNAARRLTTVVASMAVISQPPRIFLLTRNAQPVGDGDRANPAHAVLWGFGRTLALEQPEIWGGIIDVDE